MQEKIKVLIIDDDQELCSIIDRYLKNAGYETQLVHTGAGGLQLALAGKIRGLQLGADDYLTKPFSMAELMARVDSLVRRYTKFNQAAVDEKPLILNHLTLNRQTRIVLLDEKPLELTGKEFELLYFLASHKGQIFTKRQIYQQVWGADYAFDDNNIMSFISKLRKKIEPDVVQPFFIQTVRGVGYRFNQEG